MASDTRIGRVESYRTERGPRQRVVAYLGQLDEEGRLGVQQAAKSDPNHDSRQACFTFTNDEPHSGAMPVKFSRDG